MKNLSLIALLSMFLLPVSNAQPSQQLLLEQLSTINSASAADIASIESLLNGASTKTALAIKLKMARLYRRSGEMARAETILSEMLSAIDSQSDENKILIFRSEADLERAKNNYQVAADIISQKVIPLVSEGSIEYADAIFKLGLYLRLQYKLSEAKKYYEIAQAIYEREHNQEKLADIYGSLGVLYESQADYANALAYQQKAMEIYKLLGGDKSAMAGNYFNLGEIYYRTKDFDLSLEYFNKALILDTELNSINDMAFDYHRLASLHLELKNFAKALEFNLSAVQLFIKQQANQALSRSYLQEAEIYKALNKDKQRFTSLSLAQKANDNAPSNLQQSRIWADYAIYYRDNKAFAQAIEFAQKAEILGRKLETARYTLKDNKMLAELYYKTGSFESAYEHMVQAFESQNQISDEQKIKESEKFKRDISLLEEQLKVGKLEKEAARKNELIAQSQLQNQIWIVGFIALFILLVVIKYSFWNRQKLADIKAALYSDVIDDKNQLLADVSHEIRTPLSALKLHVDAIQHNLFDDVTLSCKMINKKVDDINSLITDIHKLAQSDMGTLDLKKESWNVIQIISDVVSEFENAFEEQSISFEQNVSFKSAVIHCDKTLIETVLKNVLSNSLVYTDKPGFIRLASYIDKSTLHIVIDDSSPGVTNDNMEKIFRRLYRVDPSRSRQTGGSGLGLAICQSFVEAHKGSIKAGHSDLGGVKITITLPL